MRLMKWKPARKITSAAIVCSLLFTAAGGAFGTGAGAAAAAAFTPPQAVIDHLQRDDWADLQSILSGIYGSITSPLKIGDVSKGGYTTGQLVGNGDIGAIAAGVSTTSQQFYFSKNDFWGTLHAQGNSVKDNQGILSAGGLSIGAPGGGGSEADDSFGMKQDLLNAQIVTDLQLKGDDAADTPVQLRSWTADTDNVFVTEIENKGGSPVTLRAKQWVPKMAYASGSAKDLTDANATYPYTGGIAAGEGANPVLWTTRDSNAGEDGNTSGFRSRIATATTVVGANLVNAAEKVEATDYYDSFKGSYYDSLGEAGDFTVAPGATAYVVSYFASSSGAYDGIKSVSGVQADAVSGVSAYTTQDAIEQLKADHLDWWKTYWLKSYAQFNDDDLNRYAFSSLYILGSSNRPTSESGKVNAQNLPSSMYGPWVPADNMGWGGRYFLNYNQQAQYYASGSENRIETAIPYNRVIAYDRPWQLNNAASQGHDGAVHVRTLSPFHLAAGSQPDKVDKAPAKTYGFSLGSTDQKSNGYFAVMPMVFYYEYTLDDEYLKNVLYPYLKDLMTFYSSYVLKQDDGNGRYHYSVIGSSIHEGDAADINPDLDIGAIKFMANFLAMHASEMDEEQANVDRWKDLRDHTSFPEAMLPQGVFDAGNAAGEVPTLIATDYQSPNQPHVDIIEPGDQPVELEGVVFPFENVQLLDGDKELLQKVRNTLLYMNAWSATGFSGWNSQNNGFPKVYPIAAKAGWPAADLLSKFKTALAAKLRGSNLTYYQNGGAIETIGAMEGLNSMLLQTATTSDVPSTIQVFPNWDGSKSVRFERLGAKGNVTVSSAYDADSGTVPYVDLYSRRDGKIALVDPWTTGTPVIKTVNEDNRLGSDVPYTIEGGKLVFEASNNARYIVMNDASTGEKHVSGIDLDRYSVTLVRGGTGGTDSVTVSAYVYGNPDDTLVWTSSDPEAVTVTPSGNSAVLKAAASGTAPVTDATVTVRSTQDSGIRQTVKVKIADASTVPSALTLISPAKATIFGPASTGASTAKVTGNRLQLTAIVSPAHAYDKRIKWKSDNTSVAMVDKNGLVIPRGAGTATITGTSMANPALPAVKTTVTVTSPGTDHSADPALLSVLAAAKTISAYAGDKTGGGGFKRVSDSPAWEGNQEAFQRAYINALGVKDRYSGYSTVNISADTAFFAAVALNEAIRSIDPDKAQTIEPTVDKTALNGLIASAGQMTANNFAGEQDWTDFQAALTAAEAVNDDPSATTEEVDAALAALQAAMDKAISFPVVKGSVPTVALGAGKADIYGSSFVQIKAAGSRTWSVGDEDGAAVTTAWIDPSGVLYATAEGTYRVTSEAQGGAADVLDVTFHNLTPSPNLSQNNKGTGTAFGSTSGGSYPPTNAFDGSPSTFYEHNNATPYVGWDFGSAPKAINVLRFLPRSGTNAARITGAKLQGSNSPTDAYVDLVTITDTPTTANSSSWYVKVLDNSTAYRYYRWLGATGTRANVAEIQLYVNIDKTALGTAIAEGSSLKSEDYTESSWNAFQEALDAAKQVNDDPSALPTEIDTAAEALADAIDGLEAVADDSAQDIASGIDAIEPPAKDAVGLTLPAVPEGYTIAIKESDRPDVIAVDGTIVPPAEETAVSVVLTVTKTADGSAADTAPISVIVPAKSKSAEEVAATITSIPAPEKDATRLTLPAVPEGFKVAIGQTSKPDVIDLSGKIVPPASETTVSLVLTVTMTVYDSTADTAPIDVVVPAKTAAGDPDDDDDEDDGDHHGGHHGSGESGDEPAPPAQEPGTLVVDAAGLTASGAEEAVVVTAKEGTRTIMLPANAAKLLGDRLLQIRTAAMSLDIPAALMAQLTAAVPADELRDEAGGSIRLTVRPNTGSDVESMLAASESAEHADIKAAGEVYELGLAFVSKDGRETKPAADSEPMTIRLSAGSGVDPALTGIYSIAGDGTLVYIGGSYESGEFTAAVRDFGKYALLEYSKTFADVPADHWAFGAIRELAAKHIVTGTGETSFEPKRSVTRAEFTAMLVRALGLTGEETMPFSDVGEKDWYAEPIAAAVKAGIATGRGESLFDPGATITRQEMVVMLMRAYAALHATAPAAEQASSFGDEAAIAAWAIVDVRAAASLQLINGREEGKFEPNGTTTRAEAAETLSRLLKG